MSEAGSNPFGLSEVEFAFYEFAKSSGKVSFTLKTDLELDLPTHALPMDL